MENRILGPVLSIRLRSNNPLYNCKGRRVLFHPASGSTVKIIPFFSAARFEMCKKYQNYPFFRVTSKNFMNTPRYEIRMSPPPPPPGPHFATLHRSCCPFCCTVPCTICISPTLVGHPVGIPDPPYRPGGPRLWPPAMGNLMRQRVRSHLTPACLWATKVFSHTAI